MKTKTIRLSLTGVLITALLSIAAMTLFAANDVTCPFHEGASCMKQMGESRVDSKGRTWYKYRCVCDDDVWSLKP